MNGELLDTPIPYFLLAIMSCNSQNPFILKTDVHGNTVVYKEAQDALDCPFVQLFYTI
jgi:hypothetical protein